ncbi:MAG TPA: hypothetical protein VIY48_21795 [Candidatus Paceibacterota bacterium]
MIIPLRFYLVGAGLVALVSFGGLWLHEHDKRVQAEVRSKIYQDSVATLHIIARDDSVKIIRADSLAHANALAIAALQTAAWEHEEIAKANTKNAVERLKVSLSADQRKQLDSIVLQYDARLAAKDSLFAATMRLNDIAHHAQIAARDSSISNLRQLNVTLQNAWDNERKLSHTGFTKRLTTVVAAVAVGYSIRALTTNN